MGGRHEGGMLNEVLVFNTTLETVEVKIHPSADFRFDCESSAMLMRNGIVYVLGDTLQELKLIKYCYRTNKVTSLMTIGKSDSMRGYSCGSH